MKIVNTRDTMSDIYLQSLKIRYKVFVEEQKVPFSMEVDKEEAYCVHFVLLDDNEQAVGTVRLLPNEKEKSGVLQRLAVTQEYRGNGYGVKLVEALETFAKNNRLNNIVLHAQVQVKEFYASLGYTPFGEIFEEAGIDHISMEKAL